MPPARVVCATRRRHLGGKRQQRRREQNKIAFACSQKDCTIIGQGYSNASKTSAYENEKMRKKRSPTKTNRRLKKRENRDDAGREPRTRLLHPQGYRDY